MATSCDNQLADFLKYFNNTRITRNFKAADKAAGVMKFFVSMDTQNANPPPGVFPCLGITDHGPAFDGVAEDGDGQESNNHDRELTRLNLERSARASALSTETEIVFSGDRCNEAATHQAAVGSNTVATLETALSSLWLGTWQHGGWRSWPIWIP